LQKPFSTGGWTGPLTDFSPVFRETIKHYFRAFIFALIICIYLAVGKEGFIGYKVVK
jgi:hypothetical protein